MKTATRTTGKNRNTAGLFATAFTNGKRLIAVATAPSYKELLNTVDAATTIRRTKRFSVEAQLRQHMITFVRENCGLKGKHFDEGMDVAVPTGKPNTYKLADGKTIKLDQSFSAV